MTPRRTILFLQGPASPFFARVAAVLEAAGARTLRVNFCLGDRIYDRGVGGRWFRGPIEGWGRHLDALLARETVTDVVMLGDGRPYHRIAVERAGAAGVRVHVVEHGYLRPGWLTLEPGGMASHSRFPRDPAAIRALALRFPPAPPGRRYRESFLRYALYDLAYHLPNVALGWLVHPRFVRHAVDHPAVEYGGWILKALRSPRERRHTAAALERASAARGLLFLFPLQLATDYQIRLHAPGGDLLRLAVFALRSFARHAPTDAFLLFKVHPIDNGLGRWRKRLLAAAAAEGVPDRVAVADGGDLDALLRRAAGVVTVNSTVGTAAIAAGVPLIALGNAIYDVPGLAFPGPLEAFWTDRTPPDAGLADAFFRALVGATQLPGSFVAPHGVAEGALAVAERILNPVAELAPAPPGHSAPVFRRAAEIRDT